MLRICVSGLTDTGKTTIGKRIAKELNITHLTKYNIESYKDFKKNENGMTYDQRILQTANKDYAASFDKAVAELADRNDCIVTTWLGPWIVKNPTVRVWLTAPFDERAKRCSIERNMSIDEAKAYVETKDKLCEKAFKELYNIDVNEHSNFDMEINTGRLSIDETASLISMLAIGKEKNRFR